MKKHLHNSLRALFLSLAVLLSMPVLAEEVEINGINYDLVAKAKQATVIAKSSGKYSGEIVIPESVEHEGTAYSVTSIGGEAFRGCSDLTSVTIGNCVESIGEDAFFGCSALISVTVGNSVTSIGDGAFYWCSGLISVTIPNSVTSIGVNAFRSCSGLTSVIIGDGVTNIGDCAFLNCSGLTSVTIGNSVKSIWSSAFQRCSSLTSVTLPNSVTYLGQSVFEDCSGLTSVTIGSRIQIISNEAFANCPDLLDVYCYAENVPSAYSNAFDGSYPEYVTLHVPAASINSYKATEPWNSFRNIVDLAPLSGKFEIDGINYELNGETKQATVIKKSSGKYSGEVVIPESVEHEGTTYSVARIGGYAFYGCEGLTSVTIPNSVTSIGYYAFGECSGLTSVTIGNSVTSIGEWAFCSCSGLTSVTIPNSVTSIEEWAFYYCSGLTSVTVGNSVTRIGEEAFAGCKSLTSVTIPNSVTSIGSSAFASCSGLTEMKVDANNSKYDSREGCNAIIETSSNTLLYGCQTTVIPNSVTSIGGGAFYNCSGLTSVTIPNSVTRIVNSAFRGCSGLTSVTIPNSVTSIGDYAFYGCSGLTSVTIPNSVESIGWGTFWDCSGLTSVTIGNSVTSIGNMAFYECERLTSVTIGNSVTSIGDEAFYNCSGLQDVYCYAENVPSTGGDVFLSSSYRNATLHVPTASIESYQMTEPWSSFGTITALKEDLTLADGEEFENIIEQEVATLTYTRTLSKTNTWNALYVPFEIPMTAEFCQNYDVAYFNDVHCYDNYVGEKENGVLGQDGVIDGMDMEVLKAQEGSVLNANYPYLIRAKNTDALNMNIKVEDATLYSAKETTISCSSVFMKFDVTGIYTTQTAGELKGEYDVYAISGGGWKQALNANQQLKPFRLYLKLTSIDGSPVKATEGAMSRINIRVQGEDTETGIDELKGENGKAKTDIYDLSGRRVQKAQKGIFIQNGKKVIM